MSPVMTILFYLSVGLAIFWIAGRLAAFVKKKTGNVFVSVAAGLVCAYLLLECALVLVSRLGR